MSTVMERLVRRWIGWVTWGCLLARPGLSADIADLHAPFQFEHHPDVEVELFAIEPQVVDPVALTFAANGDAYVVEMRDYPYGFGAHRAPGGAVRRLRDTDGDGRADQSTLFADQLSYPTSVMAWREGILVLAPPQLIFFQDTDDDGQADKRTVILDGFDLGVTDSNANSLRWGIDNWIHGANGGNGGTLRFVGDATEPVRLGSADFAFQPDTRRLRRTFQTGGGFGLVCDGFGHTFTTYNIDYLQQRILPIEQVERAMDVEPFAATENISDHGLSARIYPIVAAETRVNHPEQAGHFSSAGGMGFLSGPPFSDRLHESVLVCDVVCNLVHRDRLREEGPVFRAARAPEEQDREFLASRDPAFRPVGLESGPDGALYLLDMQRDVIEHPDYIPQRVLDRLDIRAGDDRGRIYRIVPRGKKLSPPDRFDQRSSAQLVEALTSDIRWQQETAHRLLIERRAGDQMLALRQLLRSSAPVNARVRSLWILAGLESLAEEDLDYAFADSQREVREAAAAIVSQRATRTAVDGKRLVACLQDSEPRVRFAALQGLDGVDVPGEIDGLKFALQSDLRSKWMRRAVLLATDERAPELLTWVWTANELRQLDAEDARREAIRDLALASAANRPVETDAELDLWLEQTNWHDVSPEDLRALLNGLHSAWRLRAPSRPSAPIVSRWLERWSEASLEGIESQLLQLASLFELPPPRRLQQAIERAYGRVDAPATADEETARLWSVELIAYSGGDRAQSKLLDLVSRPEPLELQRAAIAGLKRLRAPSTGRELLGRWSQLAPRLRADVIDLLLSNTNYHEAILEALESQTVRFSELNFDLEQRRTLLRSHSPEIAKRAALFFGDEEYSNRKAIVSDWLAQLPVDGDLEEGLTIFRSKCATCHQVKGIGHRVGPELEALSHRSVEDLLSHILDPNMAINPNYVSCVVETEQGEVINGLLNTESAETVTLLQPDAKSVTIPRREIVQMRTLETSLMPEGLEKDVTPQQMRSLIRFLQQR